MIISDAHRLAYIHIPKCAGSTVRRSLRPYDQLDKAFLRYATMADGIKLDLVHPTLAQLRTYYPDILEKVRAYDSYALVREPHIRFASSLAFYMRWIQYEPLSEAAPGHAEKVMDQVCEDLLSRAALDWTRTHFERQTAFVMLDGERIVKNLYALERPGALAADIEARHGIRVDLTRRVNPTRVADTDLARRVKDLSRPLAEKLPAGAQRLLRHAFRRLFRASPAVAYSRLTELKRFNDFVAHYYADDLRLYRSVVAAHQEPAGAG